MTCIVGYIENKKLYMGADSAGVSGKDITIRKDTKLFRNSKFLIGYTSSFRMGQLLRFKLKVPKQKTNQKNYEYMCTTFIDAVRKCLKDGGYSDIDNNKENIGTFLVGYKNKLYSIHNDLQVGESADNFDSVGCGENYAKSALEILRLTKLEPKEKVERALKVAVKFNGGVRPPFVIEQY